mmetsp:Transcript_35005/g.88191  ORF Transcript_35005/g.88191 Transcript_35005/m.88191 type:complete len:374 (-) Transcript_35005:1732-2853(-)
MAPIPPHNVQALQLMGELFLLPIDNLEGCVLFLLKKHEAAEHCVDFDLQLLVPLVHVGLDLLSRLHCLRVVLSLGVHEDRVCVTVDNLKLELLLNHGDRGLQGVSALRRDERGERLGVEAAVLESQAAVHGVGSQLQRQLANVKHLAPSCIPLGLDSCLDAPTALDEAAQDLRQDALGERAVRLARLREELCLGGALRDLQFVRALHRGKADVMLLDDRWVQAVEVEHHHELVVEADLRFEHQASGVGGLASARPRPCGRLLLVLSVVELSLQAPLLGGRVLAVRQNELPPVELMAEQHLIPLSALVLKRHVPQVAGQVRELLCERQDLQGVRQSRDTEGVVEGHLCKIFHGVGRVVILVEVFRLHGLQIGEP